MGTASRLVAMSRVREVLRGSRARVGQGRAGRHAPRLWPVPLAAAAAVLVAGAVAGLIYSFLRSNAVPVEVPGSGPAVDVLEVVKTTIAATAFVGAILAGLYAYRKQRVAEGDARRADEAQFTARYTAAADQLGHERAAARLAGVYAMANLADDWEDQRQTCIDVLCAYLRLPYDPDTASPKHRAGDREVRRTIIRIIRNHLRTDFGAVSWCGLDFSFEGAVFDCGDLSKARFTDGRVSFHGVQFVGDYFEFRGVDFVGARVWFTKCGFSGSDVRFQGAKFASGAVKFDGAKFTSGSVRFDRAKFVGGQVSFAGTEHAADVASFDGAVYTSGAIDWGPFPSLVSTDVPVP
jgi:hypothetical protein